MRRALAVLLLLINLAHAADEKSGGAPGQTVAAEHRPSLKEAQDAAWKALDDLRAAIDKDIAAGRTAVAGETDASRAAKVYGVALRRCLSIYFADPANCKPLDLPPLPANGADKPENKEARALNCFLGECRANAEKYPGADDLWPAEPNRPQQMGQACGRLKHIDWLEDLCAGGVKHFAGKAPAKSAKSR